MMRREQQKRMEVRLSQHTHTLMHIQQAETREQERQENQVHKRMTEECMTQECAHNVKRRTKRE